MKITHYYQKLSDPITRFGVWKGLALLLNNVVNRLIFVDCYHIILLKREEVKRPPIVDKKPLSFRFATEKDLRELQLQPVWDIDETKLRSFREGDYCLLNYVGTELAGYTWAHLQGRPLLIPGPRLKIPDSVIYNYAAFTLPKFRGRNHQALRHYELLNQPQWKDKIGLLGYVRYTNWSSVRGQKKSGYQSIGRMWMIGTRRKFIVLFSKSLKKLGIARA